MGYDVHITKANEWWESANHPISSAEIERLLEADPTLVRSSTDYYERSVGEEEVERIYAIFWAGPTEEVAFWFQDGQIISKNPLDATVVKMIEMAERLQARVLGDDGEAYRAKSTPPGWEEVPESGESPAAVPTKPSGRLRKFLIASAVAAFLVLCAFVGLLILAFLTPPLFLSHEGETVHVSVATLGEYPTTIDRILLIDLETSETVWELKPRDQAPQIWDFDLRPGLNPSALETPSLLEYDVVVPAGRPSFFLRKGGRYRISVWSGSWRSSASFTP